MNFLRKLQATNEWVRQSIFDLQCEFFAASGCVLAFGLDLTRRFMLKFSIKGQLIQHVITHTDSENVFMKLLFTGGPQTVCLTLERIYDPTHTD